MADLPDWYSSVEAALTKAINLTSGLDAAKVASPTAGDVYVATDTTIVYVCYTVGTWTNVGALYLLLAGGTMSGAIAMGANKITGLGVPADAGDALRKGTRVTVAELPALTDEKIWKGTGGDVEEVAMPAAGVTPTSGSYTGTGAVNRAVAHGLGATPKIVFVWENTQAYFHRIMVGKAAVLYTDANFSGNHAVTALDATNFYVGNATNYEQSANSNGLTYYWVAIG